MNTVYSTGGNSLPHARAYIDPTAHSLLVSPAAITTGTLKRHHLKAAATTNATSVKASAGQVYTAHVFNASAGVLFLKFYNKATAPVVGTDTPVEVYPLAIGVTTRIDFSAIGNPFTTGIAYGITGAIADNNTTAVVANDVIVNLSYC